MDNKAPGLTLVVPLTAVPEAAALFAVLERVCQISFAQDMGATLLLPGSHHFFAQDTA